MIIRAFSIAFQYHKCAPIRGTSYCYHKNLLMPQQSIILILILSTLLLTLPACSTPYHPRNPMGGYVERFEGDDVIEVEFWGNALTSSEKIADLTMYRCAERTLDEGKRYFRVLQSDLIFDRDRGERGPLRSRGTPRVKKWIRILSEDAPEAREHPLFMWDAKEVKESLQKKYDSLK